MLCILCNNTLFLYKFLFNIFVSKIQSLYSIDLNIYIWFFFHFKNQKLKNCHFDIVYFEDYSYDQSIEILEKVFYYYI